LAFVQIKLPLILRGDGFAPGSTSQLPLLFVRLFDRGVLLAGVVARLVALSLPCCPFPATNARLQKASHPLSFSPFLEERASSLRDPLARS